MERDLQLAISHFLGDKIARISVDLTGAFLTNSFRSKIGIIPSPACSSSGEMSDSL